MPVLESRAAPRAGTRAAPSAYVREAPTAAQMRTDIWLGAVLFVGSVVSSILSHFAGAYPLSDDLRGLLLSSAALTLPIMLRRRYPAVVAVVVCGAYIASGSLGVIELYVSQIAMFLVIYTLGAWWVDRRRAQWVRGGIIAGMFVWLSVSTFRSAADPSALPDGMEQVAGAMSPVLAQSLLMWLVNIAYFGAAYYMGDRAYDAALNRQALQERTRELEEQQEIASAQAVMLDRVRIARELHDVVAHHVSAMGVQAGAARSVVDANPEAAKQALESVEGSAREAIDELHRLLDTLRSDDETADSAPSTITLDSLDPLTRSMTAAGTPTTLRVIGEPRSVSDLVQINLFRIAQEALTNARRHGGPDVTADVRLRWTPDAVELEVTNTGRVVLRSRTGLGTLGMRERATAIGAHLEVGPRDKGGYLVRARVPVAGE